MDEFTWPRICFLAGTLGQGGAERQLFYILKTLQARGTRLRLLSLTRNEFWHEPIEQLGVPITWVGRSQSRVARVSNIIAALRQQKPDIIQSSHFYTNLYACAAARVMGSREIGAIRSDVEGAVQDNGWLLGKMSLRMPRVMAANSMAGIRQATALGVHPGRLHFLPNVIDTVQFSPKSGPRTGQVVVLAVGRCVTEKRLDRFLSIMAKLRQRAQTDVRGLILGDGPLRSSLEKQAIDLGLAPEAVGFSGTVSDVARFYRDADMLLLTSDGEGTPNVILEAMASGLPVVATKVGGTPEIVTHGRTGYLFEPANEEAAVRALHTLLSDADLRTAMGRRAREHVVANYSMERLSDVLRRLYCSVLSERTPRH